MSDTAICRPTRERPGCGHPTGQHDGNPERACDCCSNAAVIQQLAAGMNRTQRRALERAVRRTRVRT